MNTETAHYLNVFLGLGAIILQVLSVAMLVMLFFGPKKNIFLDYVDKHFLVLSFFISLFSSIFPLVYSEIIHFLPCVLCWWQRVFMFPTLFLFGTALWDKDRKVVRYATPLLSIGFLISAYQNFFYYFGENSNLPCDATGVSCYQHLVSEFGGYISIPMLALTAFFALLTLLAVAHFYNKNKV
ncbi:MAG: disulfide bond formation protein B [Candidatus Nomurabacteria bacterium]|nr:disulfide bond formation protein B [Candidatus Nomurabacteria bacterium]